MSVQFRKLFIKYCKKYLAIFLCLVICAVTIAMAGYKSLSNYCAEINELQLQENILSIQEDITKMTMLSQLVQREESFITLMRQQKFSTKSHVLSLAKANTTMKHLSAVYSASPYYFTLFSRNDIFVSTSQCSTSFADYCKDFFSITDEGETLSPEQIRQQIFSLAGSNPAFWQVDQICVTRNKPATYDNAILCIINGNTEGLAPTAVTVFVLDPQDMIDRILPQQLQDTAFLQITDMDSGNTLLSYGESSSGHQSYTFPLVHTLSVNVSFPKSVIYRQTAPILLTMLLLVIAGLGFSLYMALRLSRRELYRLKQLLVAIPETPLPVKDKEDEYDALSRVIQKVYTDLDVYHDQLEIFSLQNRTIRMENLIVHGINTPEDQLYLEQNFPGSLDAFCVAIMRIQTEDEQVHSIATLLAKEYLQELYPEAFLVVPLSMEDEVFLFRVKGEESITQLKTLFADLTNTLTLDLHVVCNVALSAMGSDIFNIHTHYAQARQVMLVYGRQAENVVALYHVTPLLTSESILSLDFLTHLYNMLLSASHSAVRKHFAQLQANYQNMPLRYESEKLQVFFSIRHVIYNAILQSAPNDWEHFFHLPNYHNCSFEELLQRLQNVSLQVCDHVEASKKSHNTQLKERILAFIHTHYTNSELTPAMVCKNVGVTDKYLFQFMKEQTGETFTSYLEKLRIDKAKEYLTQTNYSNEQIASLTGFTTTTTFYRAFQRRNKVSPGVYRSSRK